MRILTLATALVVLATAPALAQMAPQGGASIVTHAGTVANLAAICDPSPEHPRRLESIAYCQGYITAAGQYHTAERMAGNQATPLYCLPNPPPTVAESGLSFAAWARQNPQFSNEPAIDGLTRWAQVNFPCGNASQQRGANRGTMGR